MEKIDRLGWAAGFSIRSFGVKIGFRVNDPSLLPRLHDLLPPGASISKDEVVDHLCSVRVAGTDQRKGTRAFHLAYAGIPRIARSLDLVEVLDEVEGNVRLVVAALAQRRLFVHAAALGWRDRAILVPGRSHSGKSTLTEALVRAGATYYSDEYAVLDASGRVHPFAAPLSLRQEGSPRPRKIPAHALGGKVGRKPLTVGLVLSTRYRPGTKRWRPRPLSTGETAMELFGHTVAAQRLGGKALGILKQASLTATGLRGARGDAAEAANEILAFLDRNNPGEQHTPRRPFE